MQLWITLLACLLVDPASGFTAADDAYEALRVKDYDRAIAGFRAALSADPKQVALRKELAYTLMKVGETEEARDQFAEILKITPADAQGALEYAYLCNETGKIAESRRTFAALRNSTDAAVRTAAGQAFGNVDQPLAAAIERARAALANNPNDFGAHLDLARAAEHRDDGKLAAEHYLRAWELKPTERILLVDLGRARKLAGDTAGATAAFLAASRGPNARASETAREFLPARYPYASEFQEAIALDRANVELRRELAFLWLAVKKPVEAEAEFRKLLELAPDDLLSMAQIGFIRLDRGDRAGALPLLEKVAQGSDAALAKKVRDVLDPPKPQSRLQPEAPSPTRVSNREMADRSYHSGYLEDAARYYQAAREENPNDASIALRLGQTYNMLRQDDEAIRYFDLARRSTTADPAIKAEASRAYTNLRPALARFRTTVWMFPMVSSRWSEAFGYGQIKTELRLGKLPLHPYVSLRVIADSQRNGGNLSPEYLSESSFIGAVGVRTQAFHGVLGWFEAGNAMRYRERLDVGHMVPDYRGGVSFARSFGPGRAISEPGMFFEMTADALTLSRFNWNLLLYSQNRVGYTLPSVGPLHWQAVWNLNLTTDSKREAWANFFDTGPGLRFRVRGMPQGMLWSLDLVRGHYLIREGNPRAPIYADLRAGVWYAFTR